MPILAPYKLASREMKTQRSVVALGGAVDAKVGGNRVAVIAGPCSVESDSDRHSPRKPVPAQRSALHQETEPPELVD